MCRAHSRGSRVLWWVLLLRSQWLCLWRQGTETLRTTSSTRHMRETFLILRPGPAILWWHLRHGTRRNAWRLRTVSATHRILSWGLFLKPVATGAARWIGLGRDWPPRIFIWIRPTSRFWSRTGTSVAPASARCPRIPSSRCDSTAGVCVRHRRV